jgi:hypothetical protein
MSLAKALETEAQGGKPVSSSSNSPVPPSPSRESEAMSPMAGAGPTRGGGDSPDINAGLAGALEKVLSPVSRLSERLASRNRVHEPRAIVELPDPNRLPHRPSSADIDIDAAFANTLKDTVKAQGTKALRRKGRETEKAVDSTM